MHKAVIVTGGAGYIGSHICKALDKQGFLPIVIDNLIQGHREFVKWGPLIEGNVGNRALLRAALTTYSPLAVIHCAGFAYVEESVRKPHLYYRNNVGESLVLLEEMVDFGLDKIIFSSTCATYGHVYGNAIEEEHPQNPVNPYGKTKLIIEHMICDFASAFSMRYALLRYFNASGADEECEIGERHDPETHLIPLTLEAALGLRKELTIYGTDFPTPDGTAVRDFIHVDDLANGHVKALQKLMEGTPSFAVNLGSGKGTSVREVVRMAEKVTGREIPTVHAGRRVGDPPVLVANIGKAWELLNWKPECSDIETIIASSWAWVK